MSKLKLIGLLLIGLTAINVSFANGYGENSSWQFQTTADKANQLALINLAQPNRSITGAYGAQSGTGPIQTQNNIYCYAANSTATANSGTNNSANSSANAPSTSSSVGTSSSANASTNSGNPSSSGTTTGNGQSNSGSVSASTNSNQVSGGTASGNGGSVNGGTNTQTSSGSTTSTQSIASSALNGCSSSATSPFVLNH